MLAALRARDGARRRAGEDYEEKAREEAEVDAAAAAERTRQLGSRSSPPNTPPCPPPAVTPAQQRRGGPGQVMSPRRREAAKRALLQLEAAEQQVSTKEREAREREAAQRAHTLALARAEECMASGCFSEAAEIYDQQWRDMQRQSRKEAEAFLEARLEREMAAKRGRPGPTMGRGAGILSLGQLRRQSRARRMSGRVTLAPLGKGAGARTQQQQEHEQQQLHVVVPPEAVARFRSEGMVTLRGLVPPEEVALLRRVGWGFAEATRTERRVVRLGGRPAVHVGGETGTGAGAEPQPQQQLLPAQEPPWWVRGWGGLGYLARLAAAARQLLGAEAPPERSCLLTSWLALTEASARPHVTVARDSSALGGQGQGGGDPGSADPRDALNYRPGDVSFHLGRVRHCFGGRYQRQPEGPPRDERCGLGTELVWTASSRSMGSAGDDHRAVRRGAHSEFPSPEEMPVSRRYTAYELPPGGFERAEALARAMSERLEREAVEQQEREVRAKKLPAQPGRS
jgi:hypothetical protein